ncbi:MAG TPA: anhydro-N-acetylmuramic acid kinase [Chloroflexota bacterium]|nr:anhydro-N-acetylmuramic acid kinase [Chloroflexota bacterium]
MSQRPLRVLGLMSGTSADGIDSALVQLPQRPALSDVRAARYHHYPFTPAQRRAVFQLFDPTQAHAERLCQMNFRLGEWFAAAAMAALEAAGLPAAEVDLIGSHGQTVVHCPPPGPPGRDAGAEEYRPSTLQLGEPAVIAERTGITTVADFRVRDMAAGGHGAPLVSYVDALLFRHASETRVLLNLGGIANVTVLPTTAAGTVPLAYDTGPGNMVLDWLAGRLTGGAQTYDRDGELAAEGTVHQELLQELLREPYFAAPAPKTTGRERFGAAYAEGVWRLAHDLGLGAGDLMATATALTAETIARALSGAIPPGTQGLEVIAGGGGTRNPSLMGELGRRLPAALPAHRPLRLTTSDAYGIPSQGKEALSFAILAAAALRGEPNTIPSCTGARHEVVMGKIVPGERYRALMQGLFGSGSA